MKIHILQLKTRTQGDNVLMTHTQIYIAIICKINNQWTPINNKIITVLTLTRLLRILANNMCKTHYSCLIIPINLPQLSIILIIITLAPKGLSKWVIILFQTEITDMNYNNKMLNNPKEFQNSYYKIPKILFRDFLNSL